MLVLFKSNKGAVERFEKAFAQKFNAVDAVAFPYGRSAQWAFFKALGISNKEVIMPAYTCSVVAHAVKLSGNNPVFVDIKLDDYNMDLQGVKDKINQKTVAIIPTHTYGNPQNIDLLESIVKEAENKYGSKIWIMNDCCHAFGADWNGRKLGESGDVAVYAFNVSKIITTIFGGALTFQNQELADKIREFRDRNFTTNNCSRGLKKAIYLIAIYLAFSKVGYPITHYIKNKTSLLKKYTDKYHLDDRIEFPPDYLEKMSNIEAGVGLIQLKKYDEIITTRRRNAEHYENALNINKMVGSTYSHFAVMLSNKDKFLKLAESKGVELGELIQYTIPNLESYKEDRQTFNNSIYANNHVINLPVDRIGVAELVMKKLGKYL